MKSLFKYYRLFSLDIVIGGVSSALMAEKLFLSSLPRFYYLAFALTVWTIYLSDHYLDSRRHGIRTANKCYLFYFKIRKALLAMISLNLTVITTLVLIHFPFHLIKFGVFAGVGLGIYLFVVFVSNRSKLFFPKEFLIACLYSVGVFGAPYLQKRVIPEGIIWVVVAFLLLVFSNVCIYSYFSHESDKKDGVKSLSTQSSQVVALRLSHFSALAAIIVATYLLLNKMVATVSLLFLIMGIGLLMISIFRIAFRKNERFGILADMLFFLPGIYWFC